MNVERFKTEFGALAKPTLFEVTLTFPNGAPGDYSFFCKGAQIPTKTIGLVEISYMGRKIKYAGDPTYDDWTVTIYNDHNFTVRKQLEKWHHLINAPIANIGVINKVEYATDLMVRHLDQQMQTIKMYTLVGAWPSTMDAIDLAWDTNDSPEEYSATFSFDYWTSEDTSNS